jgi:hypothetical protein
MGFELLQIMQQLVQNPGCRVVPSFGQLQIELSGNSGWLPSELGSVASSEQIENFFPATTCRVHFCFTALKTIRPLVIIIHLLGNCINPSDGPFASIFMAAFFQNARA